MKKFQSVDDYINSMPSVVQGKLRELRSLIKSVAPAAQESISYGMPGYKLNGPLIYFAAYKKHIGLYPTSSDVTAEVKELARYKTGKGTLQFPNSEPLPLDLIRQAVEIRLKQNLNKGNKSGY